MSDPTRYAEFSLRARKRAATRVALVEALLPRLSEMTLEDVSVNELAAEANISPATFFNYFPTKGDLLTHFVQLWSLRVAAVADDIHARERHPLRAIEALFAYTAIELAEGPRVMNEIIAHQAKQGVPMDAPPIELVERLLYLDDDPRAATLSDRGLGELLPPWIAEAIAHGFLPAETSVMELMLTIASLFFGIPLIVGLQSPEMIAPLYTSQLRLIWAGAQAHYGHQE